MELNNKYDKLKTQLKSYESVVVAFSGGVDSTFLLKAAKESLGENVVAVTIDTPYIPRWEIKEATELAKEIGVKHDFITAEISDEVRANPVDKCYICKKQIFMKLKEYAKSNGINFVIDGSNLDDTNDYRPGMKALKELEVRSPLLEVGMRKSEIRLLSSEVKLPTFNKPSYACLLSRIPSGIAITEKDLMMVEEAENILMNNGFKAIRVRKHGDIARIEISREEMKSFLDMDVMDRISESLKEIGFRHVALELGGYKTGSLNYNTK